MKTVKTVAVLLTALCIFFSGVAVAEEATAKQEEKKDGTFKVYWKDGIRLDSADGQFKLKVGGRIMEDFLWGSSDEDTENAFGEVVSGTEFRRARLYVSGTIYGNIEFKSQYDFAGGDAEFKDMYIGLKGLPFGTLRIGKQHEPFTLEELTSSKYITFIERAIPVMFANSRQVGVAILGHNDSETLTWHAGTFVHDDGYGNNTAHNDVYDYAARVTFRPWMSGKNLLHLGGGVQYTGTPDEGGSVRFRTRPEVHMGNRYIDTHSFAADGSLAYNVEGALVYGPFHAAGEYVGVNVDSPDYGDPTFDSFYVYGGYFITGETRGYKKSSGLFDRTKPNHPWSKDGGMGAWEIAVRLSQVNLSDAGIDQGELRDITVGLNWYLNNNMRMMFNWVHAERTDDAFADGSADFFYTRFQVDF